MIDVGRPLFKPGRVVATPGAMAALEEADQNPWEFLARHIRGEWGEVDAEDAAANSAAVRDGSRILSVYPLKTGDRLWVLTDAEDDHRNRQVTTLLMPDEY